MDFGQRFPIHLPRKHYLVEPCLAIRHGYYIVVYLPLLEVCVDAHEFNVMGTVFDSTTVLEYFLQANAGVTSSSDGTFSPLGGVSINIAQEFS